MTEAEKAVEAERSASAEQQAQIETDRAEIKTDRLAVVAAEKAVAAEKTAQQDRFDKAAADKRTEFAEREKKITEAEEAAEATGYEAGQKAFDAKLPELRAGIITQAKTEAAEIKSAAEEAAKKLKADQGRATGCTDYPR